MFNKSKQKCKPYKENPRYKYGVKITKSIKEALECGNENCNNKWMYVMKLEIHSLNKLEYFEFHPKNHSPRQEILEDDDHDDHERQTRPLI